MTMTTPFKRHDNETRGRHLICTECIKKDTLIFCERPLVSLQSLQNSHAGALVCRNCKCFVGDSATALALAAQSQSRQQLLSSNSDIHSDLHQNHCIIVQCRNKCGEVYCSSKCEQEMWEYHGHDLLCTGTIPEEETTNHPLIQFKIHAIQTNEIFLMVAECLATIIALRRRQLVLHPSSTSNSNSDNIAISEILKPYVDFTLVPWWDIASSQDSNLPQLLQESCRESAALFHQLLTTFPSTPTKPTSEQHTQTQTETLNNQWEQATHQAIQECLAYTFQNHSLISMEFFGKLIGSFEQNAIGIRARHPICRDIFDVQLREMCFTDLTTLIVQSQQDHDHDHDDDDAHVHCSDDDCSFENHSHNDAKDDDTNESSENLYSVKEITQFLASLDINEDDAPDGDDLDDIFTPLDGTAMFATTCKMNHSCDPNILVRYRNGWGQHRPLILQWIALKDIKQGEELCISYINNAAPLQERTEELLDYGFQCTCPKCTHERNHPNSSSLQSLSSEAMEVQEDAANDLFGSDDDDENDVDENDLFGSNDDDENDVDGNDVDENDQDPEVDYEQHFQQQLSNIQAKISSHDYPGRMDITILAPVSSYILQQGSIAKKEFQHIQSTNSNDTTMQTMKEALSSCIDAVSNRKFDQCQHYGKIGESIGLETLTTNGSWSHTAWRLAYGCCAVTAALGYASNGLFLEALCFLDKACILGLSRRVIRDFFDYVEFHARECQRPLHMDHVCLFEQSGNGSGWIMEYRQAQHQSVIIEQGLTKPISHQLPEEVTYTEKRNEWIQRHYIDKKEPIVIRKFANTWPAIHKWRSLDYFMNTCHHRIVPIEIGSMIHGEANNMTEKLMTVGRFVEDYLKPSSLQFCCPFPHPPCKSTTTEIATNSTELATNSTATRNVAYLAQHPLFDQIPELVKDIIATPSLCSTNINTNTNTNMDSDGPITYKNVWIGTGGTRTPLHYDSYDNLLVQIAGVKYVRIYMPCESTKLYVIRSNESNPSSYGLQGNMSDVNCEDEDLEKHPMVADAQFRETILFPGDCLFIPSRVWHYVRSLSTSMSVNYWW